MKTYEGLPGPTEFVGFKFQRTFGKLEMESMAEQIVRYCADEGTWAVKRFQFDRLAMLADYADAHIINGGTENRVYERGLSLLVMNGWIDADGLRREFIERLIDARASWVKMHPIRARLHDAVVKRAAGLSE